MKRIVFALGRYRGIGAGFFFCLMLLGCAHPFSQKTRDLVDKDLTFSTVMQNPRTYIGSVVLWGGSVEKSLAGAETTLVINQMPLDPRGYPNDESTQGEFIAHTLQSLNLEVYQKGIKVTVAGEIDGVEEENRGALKYTRPKIRIMEIHPWAERVWGIFPLNRRGWEVDNTGPFPSPFQVPSGIRSFPYP